MRVEPASCSATAAAFAFSHAASRARLTPAAIPASAAWDALTPAPARRRRSRRAASGSPRAVLHRRWSWPRRNPHAHDLPEGHRPITGNPADHADRCWPLAFVPKLGTVGDGDRHMARNTSVSLGDHFADFVDTRSPAAAMARPATSSRRAAAPRGAGGRLEALRAALAEGEASGAAEPFDVEAFLAASDVTARQDPMCCSSCPRVRSMRAQCRGRPRRELAQQLEADRHREALVVRGRQHEGAGAADHLARGSILRDGSPR